MSDRYTLYEMPKQIYHYVDSLMSRNWAHDGIHIPTGLMIASVTIYFHNINVFHLHMEIAEKKNFQQCIRNMYLLCVQNIIVPVTKLYYAT